MRAQFSKFSQMILNFDTKKQIQVIKLAKS